MLSTPAIRLYAALVARELVLANPVATWLTLGTASLVTSSKAETCFVLLLTYVAVVLEHARKMDRFTVVPHSNSADEPLATDGAYPLILA